MSISLMTLSVLTKNSVNGTAAAVTSIYLCQKILTVHV